ncbi:amino acid ABC transporter permease [Agrococcus jenensis]|uniref:Amino acid ABC transporter membrane protein 1 (PAAT family) n=1 Tax=Agrococcus jenensis TaxID=46353 RepID=A0A3N2AUB8_9MICO|nr:amino acid ABC transporter permease [Agrococcus jenensis]ROR66570.1 amino acid ABC transporter membrane protein 1 (PAAT family) [Agrococcus jenensis]
MQALLENWPLWLQGMGATLLLTAVVTLIGLPIGILLAGMRVSPVAALRVVAAVWTEVARNTPLTLVFFFTAFVLPKLGIVLDFTLGAIIALTYYTSAFFAEAVRSGINSVPLGQAEASRSIGLGFGQTMSLVILPQAFRSVLPPVINVVIALVKNTSVALGFFVFVLVSVAQRLSNTYGDQSLQIFLGIALSYLIITVPLGQLVDALERKWSVQR